MIQGNLVALVTPFDPSGQVDTKALKRLVAFHLEQGTDALVAVGTTGESATLSSEEQALVIQTVLEAADGQVPVLAGTASQSTAQTIALTAQAESLGVSACLIMTPAYIKPTQAGLKAHYLAVADAVNIPIVLYNVPSRTAVDLLPATIAELSHHKNIVGIKEATGDISRVALLRATCGDTFSLLSGDDFSACEFVLAGGDGFISVSANIVPKLLSNMLQVAKLGQEEQARKQDQFLQPLHLALFIEPNPIPVKWALAQMGLIENILRLPLLPLSKDKQPQVRQSLLGVNLLAGEIA